MRGCFSSTSFVVLVNENSKGWFKATGGLGQGDHLYLFLSTIATDVLSRMLRAEERGMLEGFPMGRSRTRKTSLQFANALSFFINARAEELQNLKFIPLIKRHILGLRSILTRAHCHKLI